MSKDVLRSLGRYAPKVNKYTPVRLQLFPKWSGYNISTGEEMLSHGPTEVFGIRNDCPRGGYDYRLVQHLVPRKRPGACAPRTQDQGPE